jgi:DNA anti-recombination protein RmuC
MNPYKRVAAPTIRHGVVDDVCIFLVLNYSVLRLHILQLRDKVRYSQSRVIKASVKKNQVTVEKDRLQCENDELRRNIAKNHAAKEKEHLQHENDRLRKDIAQARQLFAGEMKAMEARRAADQEAFQKQMSDLLTQSQNSLDALRLSMVRALLLPFLEL